MWNFLFAITFLVSSVENFPNVHNKFGPPIKPLHITLRPDRLMKYNSTLAIFGDAEENQCFVVVKFGLMKMWKERFNLTILRQINETRVFHAGKCHVSNELNAEDDCHLSIFFEDSHNLQIGHNFRIRLEMEFMIDDIVDVTIESSHELKNVVLLDKFGEPIVDQETENHSAINITTYQPTGTLIITQPEMFENFERMKFRQHDFYKEIDLNTKPFELETEMMIVGHYLPYDNENWLDDSHSPTVETRIEFWDHICQRMAITFKEVTFNYGNESSVRLAFERPKCPIENTLRSNIWQHKLQPEGFVFFFLRHEDHQLKIDLNGVRKLVYPFKHRATVTKIIIRQGWRFDLGEIRVIRLSEESGL